MTGRGPCSAMRLSICERNYASPFVNTVAKLCFATYLISDYGPIQSWLWSSLFPFTRVGVDLGVLQVLLVPTAVFAICLMVEGFRKLLVDLFIRHFGPNSIC